MSDDQMWVPPVVLTDTPAPVATLTNAISYGQAPCVCPAMWHGVCPPPPCPVHSPIGYVVTETASSPSPLSDADVDRIARRVRELQRGGE